MEGKKQLPYNLKWAIVIRSAVIGGIIGLALITVFLWGVKTAPGWPEYWKIRPFVIVPIGAACGGIFVYFMDNLIKGNAWAKLAARVVGIIGFIISLWLSTVLGLDGTLWN